MATMQDILRNQQVIGQKRGQAEQYQNLANSAGATITPGGTFQGMNGQQMLAPQNIDWGSIAQRAVGNYMGAKSNKEADEAEAKNAELSQAFMQDTLQGDPESMKLFQMSQAGIPGADRALAERISPKKEAMGAFLQFLQSGNADPEMAAELAPRYGISPELGAKAATSIAEKMAAANQQDFAQRAALKQMGRAPAGGGAGRAAAGKLSFSEYMALSDAEKEAYDRFQGKQGKNASQGGMTPGERNYRAKTMNEMDKELVKVDTQLGKFDNLRESLNDPKVFGAGQKAAELAAAYGDAPVLGGLLSSIATASRSKEFMQLEDYLNSEVLSRMAQLGGSDSNEELRRMRASLPSVMNDQKAALALMDQLNAWQKKNAAALRQQRGELQSGAYYDQDKPAPNYMQDQLGAQPAAPAPKGKIKILSIE